MLVLSRKAKQQIQIGPDITITVLQVKGQCVRLGIEAPRDICVLRSELAEKIPHEESSSTVEAARKKLRASRQYLRPPTTKITVAVRWVRPMGPCDAGLLASMWHL